jgi:hypothetical protein
MYTLLLYVTSYAPQDEEEHMHRYTKKSSGETNGHGGFGLGVFISLFIC